MIYVSIRVSIERSGQAGLDFEGVMVAFSFFNFQSVIDKSI